MFSGVFGETKVFSMDYPDDGSRQSIDNTVVSPNTPENTPHHRNLINQGCMLFKWVVRTCFLID
jgi:hypothetical protein